MAILSGRLQACRWSLRQPSESNSNKRYADVGNNVLYGMLFAPIIMNFWLVTVIVVAVAVIRWLQVARAYRFHRRATEKRALESFTKLLASVSV